MKVAPRSVLITGANRGLGLEMVRQLLALPTPPKLLFATCRNPDNAKDLQEIASSNSAVKVLKFDVTKLDTVDSLCGAVAEEVKGEGLNMLINNAGINSRSSLSEVNEEVLTEAFKTNTVSPLLITKAFVPLLRQAATKDMDAGLSYRRAMVVNVSSILGSMAEVKAAGLYDYRISKAGLNMATRCLAMDLGTEGVLALAVHPGWVQTDMGGPSAAVTPQTSIAGLFNLFSTASEKHAGMLYAYNGQKIEW